jgi:transposase
MARQWVTDELWKEIEPLIPEEPPKPKGGRPRHDDRACLVGIIFVLKTGAGWNQIPAELAPSGPTCWRRFREWTALGIWDRLWKIILRHLGKLEQIDLRRAVIDSASGRAVFGGTIPVRTLQIAAKMASSAI